MGPAGGRTRPGTGCTSSTSCCTHSAELAASTGTRTAPRRITPKTAATHSGLFAAHSRTRADGRHRAPSAVPRTIEPVHAVPGMSTTWCRTCARRPTARRRPKPSRFSTSACRVAVVAWVTEGAALQRRASRRTAGSRLRRAADRRHGRTGGAGIPGRSARKRDDGETPDSLGHRVGPAQVVGHPDHDCLVSPSTV